MSIVGRSVLGGKALPVTVFFLAVVIVGCVPAAKKLPTDSVTSPTSLTDLPKEKRLEELPVLQLEEKVKKPEPLRVYSLSVRDADVRDVLQGFSKQSKANIVIDPDVSGKVTIDLKDVTMAQAMDALLTPMGLEYKVDSGFIRVSKPKAITRMFRLNYILTTRTGERSLSTSVGSTTTAGGGGGTTGGGFTAGGGKVTGVDTQDIFRELEMSLVAIGLKSAGMLGAQGGGGAAAAVSIITTLPPGVRGLFSINRQAGIILVTAFPEVIAKVAELIEAVEGTVQRQVLIQAKIVEVSLNDEFRYGINYDMLFRTHRRRPDIAIGQSMDANKALLPDLARDIKSVAGFFQFTLRTGDIEPIVEALSVQGDVNVISSPKISTLNNQTAILRVGQQKTFFSVSTTITSGTGTATTSSNVDKNTITVGVTLDVTPQISQDGFITMNIHPSVTEQVGETSVTTPTASATAPILDVRETDTVIRVKDSETIAIGGLMQDKKDLKENQVPVLGKIPGLSFLFKEVDNKKRKIDLVIFLTPTILVGERVEDLSTEDIQRLKLTERR